jgi:hypothetical protein
MTGATLSREIVTGCTEVPPKLVARQTATTWATMSAVTETGSHPWVSVTGESGSLTLKLTLTGPLYQPGETVVPTIVETMIGLVSSGTTR